MASNNVLQYGNEFWEQRLGEAEVKSDLMTRIQLLFSLMVFLNISIGQYLRFLFTSPITDVRRRAGKFLGFTKSAATPDEQFLPGMIYRLWHNHSTKTKHYLHEVIQECACEMVLSESDKIISDPTLKIRVKYLTVATIREFRKPAEIAKKYRQAAPFFWKLLGVFCASPNHYRTEKAQSDKKKSADLEDSDWEDDPNNEEWAMIMVITMLTFVRNCATNLLPLILGLFLKASGTSSRVISVLSNMGITVSGKTIDGRLFYTIFDNINIFLRKFQQRITNKNSMIHATNAAVIAIDDDDVDLDGAEDLDEQLKKRGKRHKANFMEDVMPSPEDDDHLKSSFHSLVAEMIVKYTPDCKKWKGQKEMLEKIQDTMPKDRPLPPKKTDARPLGVFDLTVLDWSRKVRIILGDWLTSNNLWAARRDRFDDWNSMERLDYVGELSALWHYALQATHMLMRVHLGHEVLDPTSLSAHKSLLQCKWDVNKPNYAAAKALIRHSLIARLLHIIMVHNNFGQWSELKAWRLTLDEIWEVTDYIVDNFTTTTAAEAAKAVKDDWHAHDIYFICDALLFCVFEQAVSFADPGRVLRVMRYWALSYRGTSQHNYARECVEVLLKWKYELTDPLRKALERSWFVSHWGIYGRSIASDLYLEQLNFWVKRVFIAQGNGVTVKYIIEKGSACVEAFRDISHLVVNFFGDPDRARRSKELAFTEDMRVLVEEMVQKDLHKLSANCEVLVPAREPAKGRKAPKNPKPPQSAIVDVLIEGAKSTSFDPALGYPIDVRLNTGTSFDDDENPLDCSSYEDIHGDDSGIGSLGGGGEYATGEPVLE
ncbi:hypothetical protein C8J56DRAFT_1049740 [Mycena floridula]|nr:hypothetical protein C8J56DRAFT_1049740 [Mycena floridula]